MEKFGKIQSAIRATGEEKLIYFVSVLRAYLAYLSTYYEILRVQDADSLQDDLEIFADYIANKSEFRDKLSGNKRLSAVALMEDVAYVARHVFAVKDADGKTITGDALHRLAPKIFEGGDEMSPEEIMDHLAALKYAL